MDNSASPLHPAPEHHRPSAEQPLLPLDDHEPIPFVLTTEEEPIGFALTARARRAVAPDSLPDLSVVRHPAVAPPEPDGAIDGPGDTRPA